MSDDVFTLPALIAWLETMPPDQRYDAGNPGCCLLAQWAKSEGYGEDEAFWQSNRLARHDSPFYTIAINDGHDDYPKEEYTFGRALERARAAQRSL